MKRLLPVLLIAFAMVGMLVRSRYVRPPDKVSGFIEADEVRVGSRIGGRIAEVLVQEGQSVSSSQVLMRLDPYNLEQRLAQAKAELAARKAVLAKMQSGLRAEEVAQAQARVDQWVATAAKLDAGPRPEEIAAASSRLTLAKAQLERAQRSYERLKTLFDRDAGSVSREELDRAVEDFKVAEASQRVREEELQLLQQGTRAEEKAEAAAQLEFAKQALALAKAGYRQEEIAEAEAAAAAAQAAVSMVEVDRQELEVRSDVSGVVEALELRPGDLVAPNAPVLSVLDTTRMWVRAYVPENRLNIAIGDQFKVTVDSFPGKEFTGRITFISNQAEFTPRNIQTPEERSKQVFRVKVELLDPERLLRAGMAADVWLDRKL